MKIPAFTPAGHPDEDQDVNPWRWLKYRSGRLLHYLGWTIERAGSQGVEAWAAIEDGQINVRSVSPTRRAAIVNWLCTERGLAATIATSDEGIEAAWERFRRQAVVQRVAIGLVPSPLEEDRVKQAAEIIASSPLIEAPKLPAECWQGLARSILALAVPASPLPEEIAGFIEHWRTYAEQSSLLPEHAQRSMEWKTAAALERLARENERLKTLRECENEQSAFSIRYQGDIIKGHTDRIRELEDAAKAPLPEEIADSIAIMKWYGGNVDDPRWPAIAEDCREAAAALERLARENERLKAGWQHLASRASGVILTDAAGNHFRSVFADDITAVEMALRALKPSEEK